MASVQERLQLKRMALDKWSVREQLCLASAVSCSGDQNWMSVSRSLKGLCGANRPSDWFSQKSCAVQYGELLENVETPKRKKRTASERDNQTAETPTESILRKLTHERISELKNIIQQEKEEYAKIREELLSIQNGSADDAQIREMWAKIEQEQDQKAIEQQKYATWLKEREERKSELQRTWRPGVHQTTESPHPKPPQLNLVVKPEEIEVDESSSKPGTSPLLTSLLKSPAATPTTTAPTAHPATISSTKARITAPTITNLLTGNSPTVTTAATTTVQHFQHTHQPLTGPIPIDTQPPVLPSPSKSAPTLSMLLENKNANKEAAVSSAEPVEIDARMEVNTNEPEAMDTEDGSHSPTKDEDQQLMEVFKGIIPDNIEDLEEMLVSNELLEEVLEGDDALIAEQEAINDKEVSMDQIKESVQPPKNMSEPADFIKIKDEIKEENDHSLDPDRIPKIEDSSGNAEAEIKTEPEQDFDVQILDDIKVEEQTKEENTEKVEEVTPKVESVTEIEKSSQEKIEEPKSLPKEDKTQKSSSTITPEVIVLPEKPTETQHLVEPNRAKSTPDRIFSKEIEKSPQRTNNSQDAMKKLEKEIIGHQPKKEPTPQPQVPSTVQAPTTTTTKKEHKEPITSTHREVASMEPTATITIIDTDDDSPIEVIKEDKVGKTKRDYSRKKPDTPGDKRSDDTSDDNRLSLSVRKLKERDGSESPLVDDDNSDSIPRTRRRYSSTPNIDSIPNSPASSDDREYKAWKKSILLVHNRLTTYKFSSIFLRPITDDMAPNYKRIVHRPMDLQTIKRNIETGITRTTVEFQRDVMLMCHNAIMFNRKDQNVVNMAKDMLTESVIVIENIMENSKKDTDKTSGSGSLSGIKIRSRKSHRLP